MILIKSEVFQSIGFVELSLFYNDKYTFSIFPVSLNQSLENGDTPPLTPNDLRVQNYFFYNSKRNFVFVSNDMKVFTILL